MIRRIANLLIVCLAVAICYGLQTTKPHYAELTGPIPVRAGMADIAEARTFAIRIDKITFARAIVADQFGQQKRLTTSGIWAVVSADLSAGSRPAQIGEAVWRGSTGLKYRLTERLSFHSGLPPYVVGPGLPKNGLFVFEIPPGEVRGATLLVSSTRFPRLDSRVEIQLDDLPIGEDGGPSNVLDVYDLTM